MTPVTARAYKLRRHGPPSRDPHPADPLPHPALRHRSAGVDRGASVRRATTRPLRRTWPQRLVLGFNSLVAVACLVSALAILYANNRLGSRRLVDISAAVPDASATSTTLVPSAPVTATDGSIVVDTTEPEIVVPAGVSARRTASHARTPAVHDPNSTEPTVPRQGATWERRRHHHDVADRYNTKGRSSPSRANSG